MPGSPPKARVALSSTAVQTPVFKSQWRKSNWLSADCCQCLSVLRSMSVHVLSTWIFTKAPIHSPALLQWHSIHAEGIPHLLALPSVSSHDTNWKITENHSVILATPEPTSLASTKATAQNVCKYKGRLALKRSDFKLPLIPRIPRPKGRSQSFLSCKRYLRSAHLEMGSRNHGEVLLPGFFWFHQTWRFVWSCLIPLLPSSPSVQRTRAGVAFLSCQEMKIDSINSTYCAAIGVPSLPIFCACKMMASFSKASAHRSLPHLVLLFHLSRSSVQEELSLNINFLENLMKLYLLKAAHFMPLLEDNLFSRCSSLCLYHSWLCRRQSRQIQDLFTRHCKAGTHEKRIWPSNLWRSQWTK